MNRICLIIQQLIIVVSVTFSASYGQTKFPFRYVIDLDDRKDSGFVEYCIIPSANGIDGRIYESNKFLSYSTIIIKLNGKSISLIGDSTGQFRINQASGTIEFQVHHAGYYPLVKSITVEEGHSINIKFFLRRRVFYSRFVVYSYKKVSKATLIRIKNCLVEKRENFEDCQFSEITKIAIEQ